MMTERVEIEGGGVSVAVPAAMLDPRVPMSSVLSTRTWMDELTMDERASLRRFLPNPTASEEDVSALLTTLFGDVMNGDGDGDVNGGSNMHFGNPAQRLWREIQARERDPEVMAHRVAIARVEEGAHELEVRLHHARVARAGMGMLRKFRDAADAKQAHAGDDEAVDVTREDRHRAWRERSATPEPDRPPEDSDDDLGDDLASPSKAERDELAASEEAVRLAVAVAKEAAEAAASLGTGTGAMAALRAAERAMAAADFPAPTTMQRPTGLEGRNRASTCAGSAAATAASNIARSRASGSRIAQPSASAMALPQVCVSASPPRSRVRRAGSASTRSIAATISAAASAWPRWSSIIAPAQICPTGCAIP